MSELPLVSVLVPAYNEETNIAGCVSAIAAQDYPSDRLEVVVVDGGSSDATMAVATQALAARPALCSMVLTDPHGTISSNLNTALAAGRGDIVCRVDAKSRIPPHYVRRCVERLVAEPGVAVVGGRPIALVERESALDRAIARAHNNRWTTGLSRYKRSADSGPCETVYLGAFARARLESAGGWDERLLSAEDFDLNRRLAREGTVWFDAGLRVGHVHGAATLGDLFRRQRRLGRGRVRYWRLTGDRPRARHWAVVLGPSLAVTGTGLWVLAGPRRAVRAPAAFLGSLAVCLLLEIHGADEPPAEGHVAHLAGVGAMVAVGIGWLVGIAEGLAADTRCPPSPGFAAGRAR